jgi:hypothetical protein
LIATKDKYNSFGKYKYRSCEGILESLKPLLREHEASVILNDEMVEVGGRIYVKATATLTTKDGEISATAYAREAERKKGMDDAQITGAASSYSRKYALNGLFAIDDTQDADATNDHGKNDKQAVRKMITKEVALAKIKAVSNGVGLIKLAAEIKPDCERDLTLEEYELVQTAMKARQHDFK